ncbi:DUF693 family protein [Borreliella afzelii]|uniref:Uncharacterized protein n=2 Tax=Borreliella afzelii TaxID=29518 RepID=Q0SLV3_BORAP|nr:hypothetical protein BAPKO_2053 [Borreliella afzelii PKo]ACJ73568.1 conserved hypothetical protein [Borreliella afzelii ACA-1]AJY72868.1 hypothetical protein BAFK78_A053 [Borreliella afzelii K78]APJ09189.1 hypothetical protein BLA32_04715 [Borreliella afzelii]AEL70671.1 conserved hypothetical protein [Borreliella afzelii PKo]
MLIFQYDFKIEFYNTVDSKNSIGGRLAGLRPRVVIVTQNGAPDLNIVIQNTYSLNNLIISKKTKLQIFNVPLNFSDFKSADIVKIYYKKFTHQQEYQFIMAGYLGAPVEKIGGSENFSFECELYLLSRDTFLERKFEYKNFKGSTIADAINYVFKDKAIFCMNELEKTKVINESFACNSPKGLIEHLIRLGYVDSVIVEIGNLGQDVDSKFIFTNFGQFISGEYKRLEDYGLLFVPQRDSEVFKNPNLSLYQAQVMFTHNIKIGDNLSFKDRQGNNIYCKVKNTSARLSSTRECVLNLELYCEDKKGMYYGK